MNYWDDAYVFDSWFNKKITFGGRKWPISLFGSFAGEYIKSAEINSVSLYELKLLVVTLSS